MVHDRIRLPLTNGTGQISSDVEAAIADDEASLVDLR
jgi:hypothetical protein